MMTYKCYLVKIEFDDLAEIFHGWRNIVVAQHAALVRSAKYFDFVDLTQRCWRSMLRHYIANVHNDSV